MEMFERLSGSTVLRKVHKTAESCYNFICLWLQFTDIPLKMDKVYDSRTSKWVEDDSKWKQKVYKTFLDISFSLCFRDQGLLLRLLVLSA